MIDSKPYRFKRITCGNCECRAFSSWRGMSELPANGDYCNVIAGKNGLSVNDNKDGASIFNYDEVLSNCPFESMNEKDILRHIENSIAYNDCDMCDGFKHITRFDDNFYYPCCDKCGHMERLPMNERMRSLIHSRTKHKEVV